MSNLPNVVYRALDNAGDPINGAKLYFYQPGTTTDQTVYSDYLRATPHANPVVADSNGWFAEIYMTPSTTYRVMMKNSAGTVTYFDKDNISPASLDGALNTHVYETANNPLRYNNAVGNGVANEVAAVQAAIDALGSRSGVVDLLGRTFRCDSAITLPSGIKLRNGTLDFSNCNADNCIVAAGTTGSDVDLGASVVEGASSLTISDASGFSVGDLIYVGYGSQYIGETNRISSISGTTFGLTTEAQNDYTRYVRKLTPLSNLLLEDLTLIGNPSASGTGNILKLSVCDRVMVHNATFRSLKSGAYAANVLSSVSIKFVGCTFDDTTSSSNGNGIAFYDQCRDVLVDGCSFHGLSSGVNATASADDGLTLDVKVSSSTFENVSNCVLFSYARHGIVSNCHMSKVGIQGVLIAGRDITVSSCSMIDTAVGVLFQPNNSRTLATASDKPERIQVLNNNIDASTACFRFNVTGSSDGPWFGSIIIHGNTFTSMTTGDGVSGTLTASANHPIIENLSINNNAYWGSGYLVKLAHTSQGIMRNVSVLNNNADCASTSATAIHIVALSAATSGTCVVSGNNIRWASTTLPGIRVDQFADAIINSNMLYCTAADSKLGIQATSNTKIVANNNMIMDVHGSTAGTSKAMVITSSSSVVACGNVIRDSASTVDFGIVIDEALGPVTACNNSITGVRSNAGNACIYISSVTAATPAHLTLVGNACFTAQMGIRVEGYVNGGAVVGNALQGGDGTYGALTMIGGAANGIHNVAVTGNRLAGCAYGVYVSNGSRVIHSGNSFYNNSSSHQTGIAAGTSAAGGHYIS